MPYKRKTRDEWQLHVNYGQGFEEVVAEDTFRQIRDRRREYRENEPGYPSRIVLRRAPLTI